MTNFDAYRQWDRMQPRRCSDDPEPIKCAHIHGCEAEGTRGCDCGEKLCSEHIIRCVSCDLELCSACSIESVVDGQRRCMSCHRESNERRYVAAVYVATLAGVL
jgi:hypothetical protein